MFGFEHLTSVKNLVVIGIMWLFIFAAGFLQNQVALPGALFHSRVTAIIWLLTSFLVFFFSINPVLSNIPSLNELEIRSTGAGEETDEFKIIDIQYLGFDGQTVRPFPLGSVNLEGDCRISGISIQCGKTGSESIKYSEVSISGLSLLVDDSSSTNGWSLTWNGETKPLESFKRPDGSFSVELAYHFLWSRQSLLRKVLILTLILSNLVCIGVFLLALINVKRVFGFLISLIGLALREFPRAVKSLGASLIGFRKRVPTWTAILFSAFISMTAYSFSEWIFIATKPSFMSGLPLWGKVQIWLIANAAINIAVCFLIFLLSLVDHLIKKKTAATMFRLASIWIPVFFWGITLLLLVDNFTYTLFSTGIVSSGGLWRAAYGIGFLILLVFLFTRISVSLQRKQKETSARNKRWIMALALGVPLLFSAQSIFGNSMNANQVNVSGVQKKPNIILLGSDGVSASHMSVYGYSRETTPFLDSIAGQSLVMENHFTNAGKTIGSIASLFTGKLPTVTRVIYPPDILKGLDSYQHLPGVLHELGYFNVEIAVPQYLDSSVLNLENGFDRINGVNKEHGEPWKTVRTFLPDNVVYFLDSIVERISDRLGHILFIRQMTNPYFIVMNTTNTTDDVDRIAELTRLIQQEDRPFFVHVHLMGTHGRHFSPQSQKFSRGVEQNQPWMTDYYDDSIVDFDAYIHQVYDALQASGKLENTLLFVITDHGEDWAMNEKIPLLIRFPNSDHSGKIFTNTQNLDIGPTILDYMGVIKPDWMVGQSLISGNLDLFRPIFAANVNEQEDMVRMYDVNAMKAPFFQFGYFSATVCQTWVKYDTRQKQWSSGRVDGYARPCETGMLSEESISSEMISQLVHDGYDVSSIPLMDGN